MTSTVILLGPDDEGGLLEFCPLAFLARFFGVASAALSSSLSETVSERARLRDGFVELVEASLFPD